MCQGIYIVDRRSGRIYADFPVNDGGRWGYQYRVSSTLLVANAEILNDSMTAYSESWQIKPELYNWNGKELKIID